MIFELDKQNATYLIDIRLRPLLPHIRGQLTTPLIKYLYAMSSRLHLKDNVRKKVKFNILLHTKR